MKSYMSSSARFGGVLSILTGAAYVAAAISAAMLPPELSANPNITPHEFWSVLSRSPTAHLAMHWSFVAVGLLGVGTVLPIAGLVKRCAGGIVQYVSVLAFLGFAVNARSHLMEVAFDRKVLPDYSAADLPFQEAVHVAAALALDIPDGVLTLGAIGLWIATISAHFLRSESGWGAIAICGLVAASFFAVGMLGYMIMNQYLIIASFVGGTLIFAPVWHVGVGIKLIQENDEHADTGA